MLTESASPPRRPGLKPLTGVRFIAAAAVLVFHFGRPLYGSGPAWLRNVCDSGYVGVGLFFALSGFILTYSYPEFQNHAEARRRFWLARVARVYPNYVLALVFSAPHVVLLMTSGEPRVSAGEAALTALASAFAIQAWLPIFASWNFPGWSLSVEAFFYAVFPWAIVKLRRIRQPVLWMSMAWMLAIAAPAAYLWFAPASLQASLAPFHERGSRSYLNILKHSPALHLPAFVFGILLGLMFLRRDPRPRPLLGAVLSTGGALVTIAVLALSDRVPSVLLNNGLLLPLFGAVIYGLALGGGPVAWILSRPGLVLLGEASYALYVFQVPVDIWIRGVGQFVFRVTLDTSAPAYSVLSMTIAVVVSIAVLKLVEGPARQVVASVATRARTAKVPPPQMIG